MIQYNVRSKTNLFIRILVKTIHYNLKMYMINMYMIYISSCLIFVSHF